MGDAIQQIFQKRYWDPNREAFTHTKPVTHHSERNRNPISSPRGTRSSGLPVFRSTHVNDVPSSPSNDVVDLCHSCSVMRDRNQGLLDSRDNLLAEVKRMEEDMQAMRKELEQARLKDFHDQKMQTIKDEVVKHQDTLTIFVLTEEVERMRLTDSQAMGELRHRYMQYTVHLHAEEQRRFETQEAEMRQTLEDMDDDFRRSINELLCATERHIRTAARMRQRAAAAEQAIHAESEEQARRILGHREDDLRWTVSIRESEERRRRIHEGEARIAMLAQDELRQAKELERETMRHKREIQIIQAELDREKRVLTFEERAEAFKLISEMQETAAFETLKFVDALARSWVKTGTDYEAKFSEQVREHKELLERTQGDHEAEIETLQNQHKEVSNGLMAELKALRDELAVVKDEKVNLLFEKKTLVHEKECHNREKLTMANEREARKAEVDLMKSSTDEIVGNVEKQKAKVKAYQMELQLLQEHMDRASYISGLEVDGGKVVIQRKTTNWSESNASEERFRLDGDVLQALNREAEAVNQAMRLQFELEALHGCSFGDSPTPPSTLLSPMFKGKSQRLRRTFKPINPSGGSQPITPKSLQPAASPITRPNFLRPTPLNINTTLPSSPDPLSLSPAIPTDLEPHQIPLPESPLDAIQELHQMSGDTSRWASPEIVGEMRKKPKTGKGKAKKNAKKNKKKEIDSQPATSGESSPHTGDAYTPTRSVASPLISNAEPPDQWKMLQTIENQAIINLALAVDSNARQEGQLSNGLLTLLSELECTPATIDILEAYVKSIEVHPILQIQGLLDSVRNLWHQVGKGSKEGLLSFPMVRSRMVSLFVRGIMARHTLEQTLTQCENITKEHAANAFYTTKSLKHRDLFTVFGEVELQSLQELPRLIEHLSFTQETGSTTKDVIQMAFLYGLVATIGHLDPAMIPPSIAGVQCKSLYTALNFDLHSILHPPMSLHALVKRIQPMRFNSMQDIQDIIRRYTTAHLAESREDEMGNSHPQVDTRDSDVCLAYLLGALAFINRIDMADLGSDSLREWAVQVNLASIPITDDFIRSLGSPLYDICEALSTVAHIDTTDNNIYLLEKSMNDLRRSRVAHLSDINTTLATLCNTLSMRDFNKEFDIADPAQSILQFIISYLTLLINDRRGQDLAHSLHGQLQTSRASQMRCEKELAVAQEKIQALDMGIREAEVAKKRQSTHFTKVVQKAVIQHDVKTKKLLGSITAIKNGASRRERMILRQLNERGGPSSCSLQHLASLGYGKDDTLRDKNQKFLALHIHLVCVLMLALSTLTQLFDPSSSTPVLFIYTSSVLVIFIVALILYWVVKSIIQMQLSLIVFVLWGYPIIYWLSHGCHGVALVPPSTEPYPRVMDIPFVPSSPFIWLPPGFLALCMIVDRPFVNLVIIILTFFMVMVLYLLEYLMHSVHAIPTSGCYAIPHATPKLEYFYWISLMEWVLALICTALFARAMARHCASFTEAREAAALIWNDIKAVEEQELGEGKKAWADQEDGGDDLQDTLTASLQPQELMASDYQNPEPREMGNPIPWKPSNQEYVINVAAPPQQPGAQHSLDYGMSSRDEIPWGDARNKPRHQGASAFSLPLSQPVSQKHDGPSARIRKNHSSSHSHPPPDVDAVVAWAGKPNGDPHPVPVPSSSAEPAVRPAEAVEDKPTLPPTPLDV